MKNIQLILGDITTLKVDAVVNAANTSLLGGGGVDGAIHRAAGPMLLQECRALGGVKTGQAKITKGYNLPAKWVIHTAGPVYRAKPSDAELLKSCYLNSLKCAVKLNAKTVAFPCISTGVYGYPQKQAAQIAVKTVKDFIKNDPRLQVIFVCFLNEDFEIYEGLLKLV